MKFRYEQKLILCTIQICIVRMLTEEYNFSYFLTILVKNSMLTPRQVSIIYKKLDKGKSPIGISGGAYYRQVKQCKDKIRQIIYSIILLRLMEVLDERIYTILDQLNAQFTQISLVCEEQSDISQEVHTRNLIPVLEDVISKLLKI
jgi:hypothetical protein